MARFLAYVLAMKKVNIGQLKDNLSKFLSFVEKGQAIAICKRNIPIALLVPHGPRKTGNRTKLGCGIGTVQIKEDLLKKICEHSEIDGDRKQNLMAGI